ncbi:hypothetical protein TWF102_010326 [Orbilia oligospora]|uniref:Uncharacterized protein n=1 Tax=Orbilia oligospora TaxID=2813651 RepID=A0A7C8JWM1_ORBOL|nr:hypothetical protein TWF102_010326 [Orbilia oligospora]KAF3097091.1 hypothetical protein TWF103_009620 [Orbilia oligospora]KAF3117105.1 hypothetical protein TWF706_000304 [Orbilia oligospora]KAF3136659.1 hypothetical protein TWF703_005373 [Orbilia oligospora]
MPRLTTHQLETILIKTPPNPGFTLLIDQLIKMDPRLAKKLKKYRDDKDTQIMIIMKSETEYIMGLLKSGKTDEAMKARYRLLFCAEVERQKLAAYETTTREQLIARFTTLSNDIVELSKLIYEKYPEEGFRSGLEYSPLPIMEILKRKTNLEIHNRTSQLWFIDGLKREALNGDRAAMNRLKAIELPKESWQTYLSGYNYRPRLKKKASTGTKLDAIPEASAPKEPANEPECPRCLTCELEAAQKPPVSATPTASELDEQPKETLLEVQAETQSVTLPKDESIKREGSFGKRTVANFQSRWRKIQTKFGTSASDGGEQTAGDEGQTTNIA